VLNYCISESRDGFVCKRNEGREEIVLVVLARGERGVAAQSAAAVISVLVGCRSSAHAWKGLLV
jgi:hypothetical protein